MIRNNLLALIVLMVCNGIASAQLPAPDAPAPPRSLVERIGIDQKLGAQVPLDVTFRDEAGRSVRLGDYFGKKPVVLLLVYYGCPSLCTMTLNGALAAVKPLSFNAGQEFEIVTVSFDPKDTPELATKKKATYLRQYGRAGAERGWHFLTGDEPQIRRLTQAVGYRYVYDERTGQYAHGAAIFVLTPRGKLSHYLFGVEYAPKDLRFALMEASENRIGSIVDRALLLCYQYDPASGKYGFAIMSALRVGSVLTVAFVGLFIWTTLRRERRRRVVTAAGASGLTHG